MLFDLNNNTIKKCLKQAEFGIERESLRINIDGRLAQSPHPFQDNKNIDRDFCENQTELISDVFTEPEQVNENLLNLQRILQNQRFFCRKMKISGGRFQNQFSQRLNEERVPAYFRGDIHLNLRKFHHHLLHQLPAYAYRLYIHLTLSFCDQAIFQVMYMNFSREVDFLHLSVL